MVHRILKADAVAVVAGGVSGIGLAAARRFAALGMKAYSVVPKNPVDFMLERLEAGERNPH